jgi:hypothetical protein
MIAGFDAKRYDIVANEVAIRPDRLEKYDMSNLPSTSRPGPSWWSMQIIRKLNR